MALSAWKSAGDMCQSSSGNLHTTECYLLCGSITGRCTTPIVCHYASKEHGLEVRAEITKVWEKLTKGLQKETVLLGLASIHWRETWKYGERVYRYCQLDIDQALAGLTLSAAALGWEARLLDDLGSDLLRSLLGVSEQDGSDAEEADCLQAIFPLVGKEGSFTLNLEALPDFKSLNWQGVPNRWSPSSREWKRIDEVAEASRNPPLQSDYTQYPGPSMV